ncbi:hypothetical protein EVAR_80794_1 [Eumeta japonica]|uniref:Uncharacterized protein n=1 Tax=Eumeta variegata TaxID=151549 RepID=A0A4C1WCK1_EUMVA|nr:hypothetical protein EVAR_80794_1 [Eumeta japonica]
MAAAAGAAVNKRTIAFNLRISFKVRHIMASLASRHLLKNITIAVRGVGRGIGSHPKQKGLPYDETLVRPLRIKALKHRDNNHIGDITANEWRDGVGHRSGRSSSFVALCPARKTACNPCVDLRRGVNPRTLTTFGVI